MAEKKVPMRQCLGCREMIGKKEALRVVKKADTGEITLDPTGKVNGRGAYICKKMDCLKKAAKSRGLERSLKVAIPPEVYERLGKELEDLGEE